MDHNNTYPSKKLVISHFIKVSPSKLSIDEAKVKFILAQGVQFIFTFPF